MIVSGKGVINILVLYVVDLNKEAPNNFQSKFRKFVILIALLDRDHCRLTINVKGDVTTVAVANSKVLH